MGGIVTAWTIPNILTMGRIAAAPCVVLVFVFFDRPLADWLAFGLFVGAAVTDFFDGWLARKLDQVSELGKMLDPIADKVMVIVGLMVILGHAMPLAPAAGYTLSLILIPAALIGLREVLISGVREYLGEFKLPVTFIAKCKTTAQLVAVGSGLVLGAFEPGVNEAFLRAFLSGEQQVIHATPQEAHFHQIYFGMGLLTVTLLWLAAILTVISGWGYLQSALEHMRASEVS